MYLVEICGSGEASREKQYLRVLTNKYIKNQTNICPVAEQKDEKTGN